MRPSPRIRLRALAIAGLLACPFASPAGAQLPGQTPPPRVWFDPPGRTYYGANQTVVVHFCDDQNLAVGSNRIWLNGVSIAHTLTSTSGTCTYHKIATVPLTFSPGSNKLKAQMCESLNAGCGRDSTWYVLATDATRPTVQITPGTSTLATTPQTVTIQWCDDYKLNMASRQVWVNGTPVTVDTVVGTSTSTCFSSRRSVWSLALQPGPNAIKAVVRDSAGNLADTARSTLTFNVGRTFWRRGEDRVRRPGLCVNNCFDAVVQYASPGWVSLDAERSVGLVYSSAHAHPRGFFEVDIGYLGGAAPTRVALRLRRQSGVLEPLLGTTQTEVYYNVGTGENRIAAWFDASGLATGTYRYTAEITGEYPGGYTQLDTLVTRVIVVNEINSAFGVGWSLPGHQQIVLPTGAMDPLGVTLVQGDGTAAFFQAGSGCGATGDCTYISPPSEFSTLTRTAGNFIRVGPESDSTVFTLAGLLQYYVDGAGNRTSFYYYQPGCDPLYCVVGQLGSVFDPAGHGVGFAYHQSTGLFNYFHLAAPNVVVDVTHNAARDLVSIRDPDNVMALDSMTYSAHRLVRYRDRAGTTTALTYDRWGKLASIIGPAFRAQGSSAYRDTTRYVSQEMVVLPAPGTATAAAPAARITPPYIWTLAISPRGDTARVILDGWKSANVIRDPRGFESSTTLNANGLPTMVDDGRGRLMFMDWSGPRMTRVYGEGVDVYRQYNGPGGRLSYEWGTAVPETRYYYSSPAGRVRLDSTRVQGTGVVRFTWDDRGRLLSRHDSAGHGVWISYEPTGWQNTRKVTTDGPRVTETLARDGWGRPTQVRLPDGGVAVTAYDGIGRVVQVTAPDGGITRSFYGAMALDSVRDARGQVYRWTRNQLGWVEREVRPGDLTGQHREATYDRYGRVATTRDRRGVVTTYGYDRWDRLTGVGSSDLTTPATTWAYSPDNPSNPRAPAWVFVSNAESADTVHLDSLGRAVRTVSRRPLGSGAYATIEIATAYNTRGLRDSVSYRVNGGPWRTMRYQAHLLTRQLVRLHDFGGGQTTFGYDGEGALKTITYPNGQVSTRSYTSNHELSQITWSGSALNAAAGVGFSYDAANRISSRSNASGTARREFLYDASGRLRQYTDAQRTTSGGCYIHVDDGLVCPGTTWTTGTPRTFTWDSVGNPRDQGAVTAAGNRLTLYAGWRVEYDDEGYVVAKYPPATPPGQLERGFGWNGLGQLSFVSLYGPYPRSLYFAYDGMGRRVRRTVVVHGEWGDIVQSITNYVYDGDDLLLEMDQYGNVLREYTYHQGTDQVHSVAEGSARYYYATEPSGSVLAVTDAAGAVVNQYRYGPFGNAEAVTEGVPNRLRWMGREWDEEAGLYYVRARWYDPMLRRFVSEDPIGLEGGINFYAYAGNDPVNRSDPSGLISDGTCSLSDYRPGGQCNPYTLGGVTVTATPRSYDPPGFGGCPVLLGCGGGQENWATIGSCSRGADRQYHCHLEGPSQADIDFIIATLESISRHRPGDAYCEKVQQAGLEMVQRQLGVWENLVYEDQWVNGRLNPNANDTIVGNAPIHPGLGGPVMYLFAPALRRYNRYSQLVVVHEAVHGVLNPRTGLGPSDYGVTEIGLSVDQSARYCLGRRGR